MRENLSSIAARHGTDKATLHGYTDIYERYFEPLRDQPIKLLEIGVAGGASLRTWLEYFPNAEVIGFDHNPEYVKGEYGERGAALCKEVTDPETWKWAKDCCYAFDIVIDDGGHFSTQIMAAFAGAWPLLKPGGIYAIEDTHAVHANEEGINAKLWMWLESLIHTMNEHGAGQCGRPTESDIAFVHLYKSLVIIGKR